MSYWRRCLKSGIIASVALTTNLFVDRIGTLPDAGSRSNGLTAEAVVPVDIAGVSTATASAAVAWGDRIQVTADGKGITHVTCDVNQTVVVGVAANTNIPRRL